MYKYVHNLNSPQRKQVAKGVGNAGKHRDGVVSRSYYCVWAGGGGGLAVMASGGGGHGRGGVQ